MSFQMWLFGSKDLLVIQIHFYFTFVGKSCVLYVFKNNIMNCSFVRDMNKIVWFIFYTLNNQYVKALINIVVFCTFHEVIVLNLFDSKADDIRTTKVNEGTNWVINDNNRTCHLEIANVWKHQSNIEDCMLTYKCIWLCVGLLSLRSLCIPHISFYSYLIL